MTLTLNISPELERRLAEEAAQHGLTVGDYTVHVLESHIAPDRRKKLVDAIQSWIDEGDEEEQRETGEYLIRALDEDRLSDRKLFPEELKGITW